MEATREPKLKIGDVARLTGLPVGRLRYYERRGLLEPARRSEAGYRLYGEEEVARLEFVKRAKLMGLTLQETRELVSLAAKCNRGQIVPRLQTVLEEKLAETERKMAELSAFRESLLYYCERAATLAERIEESETVEGTCEGTSFCGCLQVVTGEGIAKGGEDEDGE